eukprot:TCONS_00041286-protein
MKDFQEPLYNGSTTNLGSALVMIMVFCQKFKLSGSCLCMLIKMLSLLLPPGNIFPRSLYHFKKIFSSISPKVVIHHFCKICMLKVETGCMHCPNLECPQHTSESMEVAYFVQFDLQQQLKSIFNRNGMLDKLHHRFNRTAKSTRDIYDGTLYKEQSVAGGFLDNPHNISLILNTDG